MRCDKGGTRGGATRVLPAEASRSSAGTDDSPRDLKVLKLKKKKRYLCLDGQMDLCV